MDDTAYTTIMLPENSLNSDRPIALFIRHAERPEIPPEETGNDLNLTSDGLSKSRLLGEQLGTKIRSVNTSPITRCIETATSIRDSSKSRASIVESRVLGNPGAYVHDEKLAWNNWLEHGSETVLNDLMASNKNPPGLYSVEHGTNALLNYFGHLLKGENGFHICVSHDVVLLPFISHLLNIPITEVPWPNFLQAVSLHNTDSGIVLQYQSYSTRILRTIPREPSNKSGRIRLK